MKIESLDLKHAPECGKAMIYFRESLYYGDYTRSGNDLKLQREFSSEPGDLLELHLFDENKEYRAVYSQMRGGYIEAVAEDASVQCDEKISEEAYLQEEYGNRKLGVMNYMIYDEMDMLHRVNYRLYQVKEAL